MKLSIIILNYKTAKLTKECIKNILGLNLQIDYEILVVDNNSKDDIEKILNDKFDENLKTGRIKLIKSENNKGMGAGNNLGIKNAQGEFVLILNPDVVVLENSIQEMLDFMKNNTKAVLVSPQLLHPNRNYQPSRYRFPKFFMPLFMRTSLGKLKFGSYEIKRYQMEDTTQKTAHPVDWVRGAVMLINKNIFEKIGGFDERFFFYLEDTDFCRRVWQADFEVWYLPEVQMIHYYSRQSGQNFNLKDFFNKMAWIHIISWIKYFWKWRK